MTDDHDNVPILDLVLTKRRPGRPRILADGGKRHTVTFDTASLARARELGGGNVGAGVRYALANCPAPKPTSDQSSG